MSQVTIFTGSAGAGKTSRLLDDYCAALDQARKERRPGTTLWIVPNRRVQKEITRQMISRCPGGCFSPNVLTFDLFAEKILEAAGRQASPISPVIKRLLLRRITEALSRNGTLRYFQPIANTSGFLDVVSSFISELKREEIWPQPFMAVCNERDSAFKQRDLELGHIYEMYQDYLEKQNWYDNEGRFWLARTALANGVRGVFAETRYMAVDGFADFTQTQYEILGHFADWIDNIAISLPIESPLHRKELFAKPSVAISRIKDQLPGGAQLKIVALKSGPSGTDGSKASEPWSKSIPVIVENLFSNPRFCQPSKDTEGLEIIAAMGQSSEWEAVARRIKKLLADDPKINSRSSAKQKPSGPARPQDIVIGLRSIRDDGPRLRDYLKSAGLPVWCDVSRPLAASPIVKAMQLLLTVELEDWTFDRLLAFLDSNFFHPDWPEVKSGSAARAVASTLRRLRLGSGRETILKVVGRHANDAADVSQDDVSFARSVQVASELLARLSRCLEPLRRRHSLADWADVLSSLINELGWTAEAVFASRGRSQVVTDADLQELDLFQRIVRTAAEADQAIGAKKRSKTMSLDEFATELRDLLENESLKAESEPTGCIRILDVEQIRNLDVPYLFLIGLTEDSFPRNRTDDCLFSESERQDFISRGIRLGHRSQQHADEMLLFYSVVTRARKSLTLSSSVVNSKGQPVYLSPYLTALIDLFDCQSLAVSREGKLDPVPSIEIALTRTDLRLAATIEARDGKPGLYRTLLDQDPIRRTCLNTLAAIDVADQRFHQRGFTAYEGKLELSQNLDLIRRRFGPDHQFSATELEAYARCPFQFWLSNVLRIEPLDTVEEGTDFRLRGTLLHDVLAQLVSEQLLDDPDAARQRFGELVDDRLGRHVARTDLQKSLIELERSILAEWADAFSAQQAEYRQNVDEYLKDIRPLAPEIPFGNLPDQRASETAYPPIQFGDGSKVVNVRGRIDRVDLGTIEGKPAYIVVDYKTGQRPSTRPQDLVSGRSMQLALYLIAAKRLGLAGPDAVPFQMGYWALKETGFKPGIGKYKFAAADLGEIQKLESILDALLPELAAEIRSARFVVENDDHDCGGRCPYRTVCRVNQIRPVAESLNKKSAARFSLEEFENGNDP